MPLFRRREPLHDRLAREGGLRGPAVPPHDTQPRWGESGIHGIHRPREWDALVTAPAPDIEVDEVSFVALDNGRLLAPGGPRVAVLAPLAEALARALAPPYRAEAIRRGAVWAVGARSIRVAELSADVEGDELQLTVHEGRRELRVDGEAVLGSIPALERLGEPHASYAVRATRLTDTLWEVTANPL